MYQVLSKIYMKVEIVSVIWWERNWEKGGRKRGFGIYCLVEDIGFNVVSRWEGVEKVERYKSDKKRILKSMVIRKSNSYIAKNPAVLESTDISKTNHIRQRLGFYQI